MKPPTPNRGPHNSRCGTGLTYTPPILFIHPIHSPATSCGLRTSGVMNVLDALDNCPALKVLSISRNIKTGSKKELQVRGLPFV